LNKKGKNDKKATYVYLHCTTLAVLLGKNGVTTNSMFALAESEPFEQSMNAAAPLKNKNNPTIFIFSAFSLFFGRSFLLLFNLK